MIHIFDLDHTLFRVNSSYHFCCYLYRRGKITFSELSKAVLAYGFHKLGFFTLEETHHKAFETIFCGKRRSDYTQYLPHYLDENLPNILSPAVFKRLEQAQKTGKITALYSSSPDFIVEAVAKRLKINFVEFSQYEVDKDGRFVKILRLLNGEGKRMALQSLVRKQGISLCHTTAYSDSVLDLPLLKVVGKAVCVSPDNQLKQHALKQGWEILDGRTKRSNTGNWQETS